MPRHKGNKASRALKKSSGLAGGAARKLGGRAAQLRAMEAAAMGQPRRKSASAKKRKR